MSEDQKNVRKLTPAQRQTQEWQAADSRKLEIIKGATKIGLVVSSSLPILSAGYIVSKLAGRVTILNIQLGIAIAITGAVGVAYRLLEQRRSRKRKEELEIQLMRNKSLEQQLMECRAAILHLQQEVAILKSRQIDQ